MRTPREPWKCAHCSTLNLSNARSCRRCGDGRPVLLTRDDAGSPGLAAVCSGLLPGLGQLYQQRWIRGAIIFLIPILAVALGGAFIATFDPLTSLVVRHAVVFTVAVIGGLLLYHLWVVADAFAGGLRQGGLLRRKHPADYFALGIVTLALIAGYGSIYRGANAWAGVAAKVFAPVAGATARGVSTSFDLPPWNGRERLNVLVLGIDSRGVAVDTQNTDTMIVLSIDPMNRTAAMLSVPRDTLAAIPGHGSAKVNSAFALGGPDLAQKTVEALLGIRINSYALINFPAFTEIVDSVGGVLVDVKRSIRDEAYPTADFGVERLNIQPGPQVMSGDIALKYARSRHDSNDFSRAKRQQDLISGIRARLASDGMLGRLPAIVNDVGSAVETNFDPANILPLAGLGGGIPSSDIRSEVLLPCGGDFPHCELTEQNASQAYYLIPDKAKIANLVAELFYDPRIRQEGARIEVRGTGAKSTAAQDVADRLSARAFGVSRVTGGAAGRSEILVKNGAKRYTADQLSQQLSGIPVRDAGSSEQTDADIVVVVGTDFKGLATDLQR
ncbi:MAG TPA: LCP family protein [Candidatus Limnocylindria bacterium]|nr:LCP family protein [Candidatus Limnocylindria bacterium]